MRLGGVIFAVAVALVLTASGSAGRLRTADLSIDKINAVFSEPDRDTTYSVAVHETDSKATISYQWTLTLEAVDPAQGIDADCDNHGVESGTGATFVWHHGNVGDPVHDDDCDHSLQGKYGHQGLIRVTVTDTAGWNCTASYKGTLGSDAAAAANLDVASDPVCSAPCMAPAAPPSLCISMTCGIVPHALGTASEAHWSAHSPIGDEGVMG